MSTETPRERSPENNVGIALSVIGALLAIIGFRYMRGNDGTWVQFGRVLLLMGQVLMSWAIPLAAEAFDFYWVISFALSVIWIWPFSKWLNFRY